MRRAIVALFATCCSSPARVDAPTEPAPDALPACRDVTESSCDGGWAACDETGACGCYVGPELRACRVPCRGLDPLVPSCRTIGCDERDTYACSVLDGRCFCERAGSGKVEECELERCSG